jgi:hypothetical protein
MSTFVIWVVAQRRAQHVTATAPPAMALQPATAMHARRRLSSKAEAVLFHVCLDIMRRIPCAFPAAAPSVQIASERMAPALHVSKDSLFTAMESAMQPVHPRPLSNECLFSKSVASSKYPLLVFE